MVAADARTRWAIHDARFRQADREDVDFYRSLAADVDGPVLELGCGTGRLYLTLLQAGVDADGLDIAPGALSVLRERAQAADLEPSVWTADMRTVTADREYDLAICGFNTLQNLTTAADRGATLEAIHDLLAPGGRFVFDVFVPSFTHICASFGEWREQPLEFRGRELTYRTRSRITDEVCQTYAVDREALEPDGTDVFSETIEMTLLPAEQVRRLATTSPFESATVTGDYTDEPLCDDHGVQVWTLRV